MTTLRDILNDLITETEERVITEEETRLNDHEKELMLDDYIERIKERIIG